MYVTVDGVKQTSNFELIVGQTYNVKAIATIENKQIVRYSVDGVSKAVQAGEINNIDAVIYNEKITKAISITIEVFESYYLDVTNNSSIVGLTVDRQNSGNNIVIPYITANYDYIIAKGTKVLFSVDTTPKENNSSLIYFGMTYTVDTRHW